MSSDGFPMNCFIEFRLRKKRFDVSPLRLASPVPEIEPVRAFGRTELEIRFEITRD